MNRMRKNRDLGIRIGQKWAEYQRVILASAPGMSMH
jgi:hypothetical protein